MAPTRAGTVPARITSAKSVVLPDWANLKDQPRASNARITLPPPNVSPKTIGTLSPAEYRELAGKPRRQKYGAKPTWVEGIRFSSSAEAKRYRELRLLEAGGYIRKLELQPVYEFKIDGVTVFKYVSDFRYMEGCTEKVEDVKGCKTPVYRLKKRLIEAQFKIKIIEVS